MLAVALRWLLRFILTRGQPGDVTRAPALLEGLSTNHVIADAAYDIHALRALIAASGATAVIPSHPTRIHPFDHDPIIYRLHSRIERCFNKLKHFRCLTTRYDRGALFFLSFIQLATAMIWMR